MLQNRLFSLWLPLGFSVLAVTALQVSLKQAAGQSGPAISISDSVPRELNPSNEGARTATPEQAAAFAWQEFIALNWPAGPQQGQPGQREAPSSTCRFGDVSLNCALLVWETFRGKVEIFPGDGNPPPGYAGSNAGNSWGYDAPPVYNYSSATPLAMRVRIMRGRGSISTKPIRSRSPACMPESSNQAALLTTRSRS